MTTVSRVIVPITILIAVGSALAGQAPDFCSSQWYDQLEKVRSVETAQFIERRTEETNVAVSPPKSWKVEHLYFKDTLLGHPILVLYRFDLECLQLYQADYIFPLVLEDADVFKLIAAIEDKYKTKLATQYVNKMLYSNGNINDSTAINISQNGLLHFHNKNTTVSYHTTNWSWLRGWVEGKEPMCQAKKRQHDRLEEKL